MTRAYVTALFIAVLSFAAQAQESGGEIMMNDTPLLETSPAVVLPPADAPIDTTPEQRAYELDAAQTHESDGIDYVPPAENLIQHAGEIIYATGGVGEDERAQIKSMESQFNLKVLVTTHEGAYIGDYTLRITNAEGKKILQAPGDGPYFYVKLPVGTYNVDVSDINTNQKPQKVTISDKVLKTIYFRW